MELVPIGVAARRLGMATSALRYYDERAVVPAATRENGRRMYGPEELRRLAFVKIAQRLGIRLDVVASMFDGPGWRGAVQQQIDELDELIDQARGAREFLVNALLCPSPEPAADCPEMLGALDHVVAGGSVDALRHRA